MAGIKTKSMKITMFCGIRVHYHSLLSSVMWRYFFVNASRTHTSSIFWIKLLEKSSYPIRHLHSEWVSQCIQNAIYTFHILDALEHFKVKTVLS
jgi:hypothetical protein